MIIIIVDSSTADLMPCNSYHCHWNNRTHCKYVSEKGWNRWGIQNTLSFIYHVIYPSVLNNIMEMGRDILNLLSRYQFPYLCNIPYASYPYFVLPYLFRSMEWMCKIIREREGRKREWRCWDWKSEFTSQWVNNEYLRSILCTLQIIIVTFLFKVFLKEQSRFCATNLVKYSLQ